LWGFIAERYDLTVLPTRRLLIVTPKNRNQSKK